MRVVILKLGAIGDIALACQAIASTLGSAENKFKLHWIIDEKLEPLAKHLIVKLAPSLKSIKFHPIDSQLLFQGTFFKKLYGATKLFFTIFYIKPSAVMILHRDLRYFIVTRLAFIGRIIQLSRCHEHEFDAYLKACNEIAAIRETDKITSSKIALQQEPMLQPMPTAKKASAKKVGILVGGATNSKLTYLEKRWPYLKEFIHTLSNGLKHEILLFGEKNDQTIAYDILATCPLAPQIQNRVGNYTLVELVEELSKLDVFISIDSGPAHIASVVMTKPFQKVIVLFGPTDPNIWAPRTVGQAKIQILYENVSCSPCYKNDGLFKPCKFEGEQFQQCMKFISPAKVIEALNCF